MKRINYVNIMFIKKKKYFWDRLKKNISKPCRIDGDITDVKN